MPELPEVETIVRSMLNEELINCEFLEVEILKTNHVKGIEIAEFKEKIRGEKIRKIGRKGKWIMLYLENYLLFIHLRMSGKIFFQANSFKPSLIFKLSKNKKIFFCDPRGFGVIHLQKISEFKELLPYKKIGPDMIQDDITADYLAKKFLKLKIPIKVTLLEQSIVSGIGNIYASEILFASRINPLKNTNELSNLEIENIIENAKKILNKAIEMKGTSVVDFVNSDNTMGKYQHELKVYMRKGKNCHNCQQLIKLLMINKRGSFYCENCQKLSC